MCINKKLSKDKKEEVASDSRNLEEAESGTYDAVCDTCEEKIKVPFKPDPARPTFCKECLKDYQRARALNQKEQQEKQKYVAERKNLKNNNRKNIDGNLETPILAGSEKPMSLNQMSHMTPKKFKPNRKKSNVNLKEVRDLIKKTKIRILGNWNL